jgi:hypothetical protein
MLGCSADRVHTEHAMDRNQSSSDAGEDGWRGWAGDRKTELGCHSGIGKQRRRANKMSLGAAALLALALFFSSPRRLTHSRSTRRTSRMPATPPRSPSRTCSTRWWRATPRQRRLRRRRPWLRVWRSDRLRPTLSSHEAFWLRSTLLYFWGTKEAGWRCISLLQCHF